MVNNSTYAIQILAPKIRIYRIGVTLGSNSYDEFVLSWLLNNESLIENLSIIKPTRLCFCSALQGVTYTKSLNIKSELLEQFYMPKELQIQLISLIVLSGFLSIKKLHLSWLKRYIEFVDSFVTKVQKYDK